jgi:hypothetical protein
MRERLNTKKKRRQQMPDFMCAAFLTKRALIAASKRLESKTTTLQFLG